MKNKKGCESKVLRDNKHWLDAKIAMLCTTLYNDVLLYLMLRWAFSLNFFFFVGGGGPCGRTDLLKNALLCWNIAQEHNTTFWSFALNTRANAQPIVADNYFLTILFPTGKSIRQG